MLISWQGFNYFRLQNGDESLIVNPYALDKKTKFGKAKANLVLFSNPEKVEETKMDEDTLVISSAGEYEAKDMFVYGRRVGKQLVYLIIFDGIRVAFLGEFKNQELSNGDLELIEGADILILPVGGGDMLDAKQAAKIVSQIEPRVVIPSAYEGSGVNAFIKEFGVKPEEMDKYKVKKADLPQEDVKLIILKAQAWS